MELPNSRGEHPYNNASERAHCRTFSPTGELQRAESSALSPLSSNSVRRHDETLVYHTSIPEKGRL
jgi:hypothetical protein